MSDAYLLDTSIASIAWDGGNKHPNFIRQQLASLDEDSISICAISLVEVEYGLLVSPAASPDRHTAVRSAMSQYKRHYWKILTANHTNIALAMRINTWYHSVYRSVL